MGFDTMWKIPLSNIDFDHHEIEAAEKVLRSGWLTMGEVTEEFERKFAQTIGVKHAIAVSSCTAALHMAHAVLGIGEGDEVICPGLTFVAGANAILYVRARPVFAEITCVSDLNISPEDIEKKITDKTKAIQVVHYAGFPCDMNRIMDIARQNALPVIEDCAHSVMSWFGGKACGTIGTIGCFSFFSNKNMTTGEGGMVTTNDDKLASMIRLIRSHGMTTLTLDRHRGHAHSYDVVELGFNYRIDEMRSAIGIVQLNKLSKNNMRRKDLSMLYRKRLTGLPGLTLPFHEKHGEFAYHIFPVILGKNTARTGFMENAKHHGIQTSIHYPAVHLFGLYRKCFGYNEGVLPVTEDAASREVTLPLYPSMTDNDVHYVCDVLEKYCKEKG